MPVSSKHVHVWSQQVWKGWSLNDLFWWIYQRLSSLVFYLEWYHLIHSVGDTYLIPRKSEVIIIALNLNLITGPVLICLIIDLNIFGLSFWIQSLGLLVSVISYIKFVLPSESTNLKGEHPRYLKGFLHLGWHSRDMYSRHSPCTQRVPCQPKIHSESLIQTSNIQQNVMVSW